MKPRMTWLLAMALVSGCGASVANNPSTVMDTSEETIGKREVNLQSVEDLGRPTQITLKYDLVERLYVGDSRHIIARNFVLRVDNPQYMTGRSIRAVLLSYCRGIVTSAEYEEYNHQFDVPYATLSSGSGFGYELQTAWQASNANEIRVKASYRNGETTTCRQELAVVVDGRWLTDPINESHNFKFNLEQ